MSTILILNNYYVQDIGNVADPKCNIGEVEGGGGQVRDE
jgi:hypothetical protein